MPSDETSAPHTTHGSTPRARAVARLAAPKLDVRALRRRGATLALLLLGIAPTTALRASDAGAACNLIPGTEKSFRSTLGTADRPFASPGDWVKLTLDPTCQPGAGPLVAGDPAAHVVTVVFQPPGGARSVRILATDCGAIEPLRAACEARGDVATATCADANQPGQPADLAVDAADVLRFRFPDTDPLVLGAADDVTYAGTAAFAVSSSATSELPCGLAAPDATCATVAGTDGLLACVDRLFSTEVGGCAEVPDRVFTAFTALPPPNNYQAICDDPIPPCDPVPVAQREVRFALDADGNVLMPMDWRGILAGQSGVPVARLLRGTSTLEAFSDTGQSLVVPGNSFLGSYSPEGGKLPPIFDPLADPSEPQLALFGSADAPATVLRIARRSEAFRTCSGASPTPCNTDEECPPNETCSAGAACVGGSSAGQPCINDAECPGGECGAAIFEFGDRLAASGTGPALIRLNTCFGGTNALGACASDAQCPGGQCADFQLSALDPVPLDGLSQTEEVNAFVLSEALAGEDLNGDGDQGDYVVRLADRLTGLVQPIGVGGAASRAVTRLRRPPFVFPAVSSEGDTLVFLEPEAREGSCLWNGFDLPVPSQDPSECDKNGDGDVIDNILRIYKIGSPAPITGATSRPIDAMPLIQGQSIVLSDGVVFARAAESQDAERVATTVGTNTPSSVFQGTVARLARPSADGRFVVFGSDAPDEIAGDTNGVRDIFVRDRATGTIVRVSIDSAGNQGNLGNDSNLYIPDISRDGRYVAFASAATNLVAGDTNGVQDVFVHDRDTDADGVLDEPGAIATERVSVSSGGAEGNGTSRAPRITPDGRFVVFESNASDLVAGDLSGVADVFLRDRQTGETVAISRVAVVNAGGVAPGVSDDGRFVAFGSSDAGLVAGDTNGNEDVFVLDRVTGEYERVSVPNDATEGNSASVSPDISSEGRFVAFASNASTLVPSDTNSDLDVFVRDRLLAITQRVSIRSDRSQIDGTSQAASISEDGRYVAFSSSAPNVLPGLVAAAQRGYRHDRLTGATEVLGGTPATLSRRGEHVTLGAGSTVILAPSLTDCGADVTGDCDLADAVLLAVDATTGAMIGPSCPAGRTAVASGRAAFLRPEAAGPAPGCPTAAPSLNLDADEDDDVVHLWSGGSVVNLGVAATDVAISSSRVAALVGESAQSDGPLNADGDTSDAVVHVQSISGASTAGWTNVGQAADALGVSGAIVAFITPEAAQGAGSLNADVDTDDRVLQIFDAASSELVLGQGTTPPARAAEELVLGGRPGQELVAFRVSESAEGSDLNDDGDMTDDVLHVYDAFHRRLLNVGAAVTPCTFEACDPRTPYKVGRDTVTFLTFEPDQGDTDLNGDGDANDLVLQVYNARLASEAAGNPQNLALRAAFARAMSGGGPSFCHALAGVSGGVCTTTGTACVTDDECGGGRCFVPPGGCIHVIGSACNPNAAGSCGAGNFCEPVLGNPNSGICKTVTGPCGSTDECAAGDTCNTTGQDVQRLAGPLAAERPAARSSPAAGAASRRSSAPPV